ncbi:unnamed protein product [Calypogeia fissa]
MQRIIDGENATFGEAYEQEIEVERVVEDLSETPRRKRKKNVDLDEEHAFWDSADVIHDLEDDLKKYETQSKVVHQKNYVDSPRLKVLYQEMGTLTAPGMEDLANYGVFY